MEYEARREVGRDERDGERQLTAGSREPRDHLLTTEIRRTQRELYFLPDRETAIGQKIAALRARSNNRVASC
jgi:hypothetical protein